MYMSRSFKNMGNYFTTDLLPPEKLKSNFMNDTNSNTPQLLLSHPTDPICSHDLMSRRSVTPDILQHRILYTGFNEDHSCFFCGTELGFYIYNLDPFRLRFHRKFDLGIGIVEQLTKSNIVFLVGGGSNPKFPPNQVIIWDDFNNKRLTELEFPTEVKAVRCRHKKIMVILYDKVMIYQFDDLSLLAQYDTYFNPKGLGDLRGDFHQSILTIPGNKPGDMRMEIMEIKKSYTINAHQNELSQICLNQNGKMVATASQRGTLIRLWDTRKGELLRELRRGMSSASIIGLSFDMEDTSLCLSSDKGTVHVYSLIPREDAERYEKNRKSNFRFLKKWIPNNAVSKVSANYLSSEWSQMSFTIPGNQSGICGFLPGDKTNLIIITMERKVYHYRVIPQQNLIQLVNTKFYDNEN